MLLKSVDACCLALIKMTCLLTYISQWRSDWSPTTNKSRTNPIKSQEKKRKEQDVLTLSFNSNTKLQVFYCCHDNNHKTSQFTILTWEAGKQLMICMYPHGLQIAMENSPIQYCQPFAWYDQLTFQVIIKSYMKAKP